MKQLMGRRIAVATVALGGIAWAGPANALRTVIDGSVDPVTTVCSSSAATPCLTPTALKTSFAATPLVADFGFGPFSSVYLYNNGLVSIGAPIAPGANLSSLASIGENVFTPGYSPSRAAFTNVTIQGPQPSQFEFAGKTVVRVTFCFTAFTCNGDDQAQQFNIFDLGSENFALTFNYGAFSSSNNPVFPADAYAGYSFGSNTVQESGTALQAKVARLDSFQYFFSASTAVPEPYTWAMLLLGFMGMGATLRHRRRVPFPASLRAGVAAFRRSANALFRLHQL